MGLCACPLHSKARYFCSIFICMCNNYVAIYVVIVLKMPSKFIRILRITFCYKQLCGRCLVHMTPVVKVVTHCVFALL